MGQMHYLATLLLANFGERLTGEVHQRAHSPGPIGQWQPCGKMQLLGIMRKLGEVYKPFQK